MGKANTPLGTCAHTYIATYIRSSWASSRAQPGSRPYPTPHQLAVACSGRVARWALPRGEPDSGCWVWGIARWLVSASARLYWGCIRAGSAFATDYFTKSFLDEYAGTNQALCDESPNQTACLTR